MCQKCECKNKREELKNLFEARDALVILCAKGFKLQDLLDQCNKDIAGITELI